MSELRARIAREEPGIEVEFVQVLQDMISDLSNAPEPVQIKLFSPDAALLRQWAPRIRRRMRPILMTALAAAAGMLPLALAIGAGSQMLQPLAIAVIGGITISMVLSLIITPAVHYYLSHVEFRVD